MGKALMTEYNGYRFRSRLEARWAVFFDALGIPYEYEPKDFYTEELGRYLPDFWLPEQRVWVEIKPDRPTEDERRKAHGVAISTGRYVCVFMGSKFEPSTFHPRLEDYVGSVAERFPGVERIPIEGESGAEWFDCPRGCSSTIKAASDLRAGLVCVQCGEPLRRDTPRLWAAYRAARGARFEHGERGAPR